MKARIDYHDVFRYSQDNLPVQQRADLYCARLYGHLFRNADALGLVFLCPHCDQRRGQCRCVQLGRKQAGRWRYRTQTAYIAQWRLDTTSLLLADTNVMSDGAAKREINFFLSHMRSL